jgi:HD-like signal output (HDOD) protein
MAIPSLLQHWVEMLVDLRLPVLTHTAAEVERMYQDVDAATPQGIAQVVLHDPLMTVQVLQYLARHRTHHRSADITTIAHALMMLGTSRFLEHFRDQPAIEDRLDSQPVALAGLQRVLLRARHAALYAHDWATLRHDVDPEEVMIAALLHDMAELLLWCYAPILAIEIGERQAFDSMLRSDDVQRSVLGFRLLDLQLELVKAWHLPELLHSLMDETRRNNPRVRMVALAAALARHSAHGWDNAALPDDFNEIAEMLGVSTDEAEARVAAVARKVEQDHDWYVAPARA